MSHRIPSTEDGCPYSEDSVKTVGRFSVSPPLLSNLDYRRSARLSQSGSVDSPTRTCRAVMEAYQHLGQLVSTIMDRNTALEEENYRLIRDIQILKGKSDASPLSQQSQSTDIGRDVSPTN